jgi:hypothetical protein
MPAPKKNAYAKGNKGGRPTKYKREFAEQAFKLCLLGATDNQLADYFQIDEATVNRWKTDHEEFCKSLRRGKIEADANVAEGLYKRAIGFQYDEITFEKVDGKIALEKIENGDIKANDAYKKKVVTKMVVPDPGAAKLWLTNRQKELWRESEFDFYKLTEQQLDLIIEKLKNSAK